MKIYGLGPRTIKTALAVFICFITTDLFNAFGIPMLTFYAAITTVFSMQPTLSQSKDVGKQRVLGTMVGAFVGIASFFVFTNFLPSAIISIAASVTVLITIYTCVKLTIPLGIPTACIIVISIYSITSHDYIDVATLRVFETMYGVLVALAVNKYVWSPKENA